MTSMRSLFHLVLFSLSIVGLAPAQAALVMTVTVVDSKHVATAGANGRKDWRKEMEVVLAETFISAKSLDETMVYDFGRRRRLVLDARTKTFDDYSLFDAVGFRELELRNRENIEKVLAAAKVDASKMPGQVEHEHGLSVQHGAGSIIVERNENGDKVFAAAGATLLRRSDDARPVSAAEAERFVKFLRYTFGGHPAILRALQKEQRIPARITYTFRHAWGSNTVEVGVSAIRTADAPARFSLEGYAQRSAASGGDALDALVDRAWKDPAAIASGNTSASAKDIEAAFRDGRPFDAFLALLEFQLSGGGQLPSFTDEQKRQLHDDPSVRQLSQALPAKDKDSLQKAIIVLQSLQARPTSKRHMLKLFEANDRVGLGEVPAARKLFVEVLQANPALVGAYKDVGDLYLRTFDTPRAWRCWDIGRRMAPQFSTLLTVTQYEQSLVTQFPEYF
ncbi:MAG TPA: hypothetical protein VF861_03050 [Telluria sp.]